MPPRKPTSADEITRMAAKMRVADPTVDNGAFSALTTNDAMAWIMALGHINDVDPRMRTTDSKEQREIAVENLRLGLWDVQRFDYLFPKNPYSKAPKFKISRLEGWPNWKKPHPEVRAGGVGTHKFDGYKDAQRLQSYVMTSFNLLAFTQPQMVQGLPMNPPKGPLGNWIGVKRIMGNATLDITAEGGLETPFVVYYEKDIMLIMEILDVKRVPWPAPSPQLLEQLQEAQEAKFSARPGAPLVPMMQTPKVPLVADGSQFLTHLESRLRERLPSRMSDDEVRVELENHLRAGEEMPEEHIRMFARLLSHNADLVDKEWVDDQQSALEYSAEAKRRRAPAFSCHVCGPRFDVVEEIETGKKSYCTPECAKAQWPTHKLVCKISKKIKSDPSALPPDTLYIPARAYIHWTLDFGFASEQETVKIGGPSVYEPPRNQYGGERFMCRAVLQNMGKGQWDPYQGKVVYHDQGGGRRSCTTAAGALLLGWGRRSRRRQRPWPLTWIFPFHETGYRQLAQVVRERGVQGQLLFVWARRDIPNQQEIRWE
ncbi:hypothetical protein B0H14DRAFT_2831817 [Mycena olivaceomarginata]|nr:hypothetical protein B0H14DRAFT_2831817 [Mycena olivaceomarginata]